MPRFILTKKAINAIHAAIDGLFQRAKQRFLGPGKDKTIRVGVKLHNDTLSLPGLFDNATRSEGFTPSEKLRDSLKSVAEQYLDAHRELAKAKIVHTVQATLHDAEAKGESANFHQVLGDELGEVMGKVTSDVRRIVDTESTRARNMGTLDGISKIAAATSQQDPTVFWVTVRDKSRCEDCTSLFLLPDQTTPRVWKLSEVGSGYWKRGDDHPCTVLHPNCRCSMTILMPGFGFNSNGFVTFKSKDHDEYKQQREGGDVE